MNFFVRLLGKIWRVLFYINFVLMLLVLLPFFYILLLREKWFPIVSKLFKVWASLGMHNLGVFYSIKKESELNPKVAYVFCANHTSYLDIIMSSIVIPNHFHFMAKAELGKIPVFGIFFKRMNIPVDRKSVIGSHKAFLRAGSDLDKGISLCMYPEGTIPEDAPNLKKFKNGPFKLAIDKQVAVVPITFLNNYKILPDGRKNRNEGRPGICRAVRHAPIETKGLNENDVDMLRDKVFNIIDTTLKEYGNK
jgi:1-acyl-sn-glycerol-3-phosphate acyltransferase